MSELVECPFCGGEAMIYRPEPLVCCANDGCVGHTVMATPEEWNTRSARAVESPETAENLWQELIEKDDRTSPEEYPDMALISFAEFSEFVRRARSPFDKATMDLCANWGRFCDADPFEGADTFADRMEAAGLIELVPVDDEALEQSFAAERGIEPGGTMWVLTDIGQQAVNASAS